MMNQDRTAQISRQMLGGKRGPFRTTSFEETQDLSITYNADGTVNTIVRTMTYSDGTQWQKTSVYSYTSGNLTGRSDSLIQLITGDDVDG